MEITCQLDPGGALHLYEQLYRHIVAEIMAGRLTRDQHLPSRRALGQHLRVSESTVSSAYELLLAEGYIRSQAKRGFFINAVQRLPGTQQAAPATPISTPLAVSRYDFSTSASDAKLFPYKIWAKLFKETLYQRPELLQRGDAQGDLELRQALSDFLHQYRGVSAGPEQVVIGAGTDYLLGTLLQLLPQGSVVAAEDPGYHGIYRACARHHIPILPIACDSEGMQLSALEASPATVCHVTPSHQFPLGIAMPIGRRAKLIHWANREETRCIIEDDYDSEFRYGTRPLPALQGLSNNGKVVYIGTFSRSLAPSMRLAYMVLPPALMQAYRLGQFKSGETVSRFEQQTLARFISEGFYLRHLRRAGKVYGERLQRLLSLLSNIEGAVISGEQAGLHFLLSLPHLSEHLMVQKAARQGVLLRGLSEYCVRVKPPAGTIIIGFAGLQDDALAEAAEVLRRAWS
jgi:GntR family transcriptional regulator/MocR family aminotransferase